MTQPVREHELKAAFLYNFTKFVEWPPESLAAATTFRICVVGAEDVASFLEALVAHEAVEGRRIEVVQERHPGPVESCQILYVAEAAEGEALGRLPEPHPAAVLTVGESRDFLEAGGMVRLRLRAGRCRIEVNEPARERSALKLSSKLLQLSDLVRPVAGQGP